jgi:hypothetical protein
MHPAALVEVTADLHSTLNTLERLEAAVNMFNRPGEVEWKCEQEQMFSRPSARGSLFKRAARNLQLGAIEPTRNYSAAEVSAILNLGYDTILRRLRNHPDRQNWGTGKKQLLRISGAALLKWQLTMKRR